MASGLFQAVIECRYLHAKYLMEGGVSINSKNSTGENVLIGALKWISYNQRRLRMIKWLLFMGADIADCDTQTEKDGLLWATFLNRTDEIKLILKHFEVDVNFRNVDVHGRSALHYAVLHNNEYVVLWLTQRLNKYRMSVDIKDNHKITPYIMATELGYQSCARILAEIGEASLNQSQSAFFKFSNIWVGIEDWSDPRFCIMPSKPMERVMIQRSLAQDTKSKVTLASVSLDTCSEFRSSSGSEKTVLTARSDVTKKSEKQHKYRSKSRKEKQKLNSKSLQMMSVVQNNSSSGPLESTRHSEKSFKTQTNPETARFLPDISTFSSRATLIKQTPPNSASFYRKSIPMIFDLYAQQTSSSYRPPARKPVVVSKPSPPTKNVKKTGVISMGVLGKVTKFAALLKMKRRGNQSEKEIRA